MLQKRKGLFMIILLATACWLCGCTEPDPIVDPKPTSSPMVSEPATPTQSPTVIPEHTATPTATPTSTSTPTPTATNTPTPTPTATPTPTPTPTPSPTPTPIPTVPPAPATINTDTSTIDFLVNREYPLTEKYIPADLVTPNVSFDPSIGKADPKRQLRKVAADALENLYHAAREEEGLTIYAVSGYRSYDRQYKIYGGHLIEGKRTIENLNLYSAAPGNSEHQTGLAMDVSCKSIGYALRDSFAQTPEGIWLKENCWRFGFILRYPKNKEHITGYAYEPWHIRYVGVPLAYYLYTNNLTLEEYYGTSSHTINVALIDMTTERFYKLYAEVKESELIYREDGSIWVSEITRLPMLKELIRDANNKIIKANGSSFFIEPIYDAEGNYVLDAEGNILYTKPYFDVEGSLWLDYSGTPVFLQPLWNGDSTLATDAAGNILYTEPAKALTGMEIITETGSLIQKVPIRNHLGELTYNQDGSIAFYEPLIDPITGEYLLDITTGLPLYPAEYYEVPHNTLPLPPEFFPTDDPVVDEPIGDEPIGDEPVVDEPIVDKPIVDEPIVDEPIVDEPIVDEPVVDEPIVNEPVVDEPIVNEPTPDTTTDETGDFLE